MKKKHRAILFFCIIAHARAMEHPPKTLGHYLEKFEIYTAMVKHRIKLLPLSKSPTGLDHPYFIERAEAITRFFRESPEKQLSLTLPIEKFVETQFLLACNLINIKPIKDPTPHDIREITANLKIYLRSMVAQRKTELTAFLKRDPK